MWEPWVQYQSLLVFVLWKASLSFVGTDWRMSDFVVHCSVDV